MHYSQSKNPSMGTPSVYSHMTHMTTMTNRSSAGLKSARSIKSLKVPWYEKPILQDAIILDIQRGCLLIAFYSLVSIMYLPFPSWYQIHISDYWTKFVHIICLLKCYLFTLQVLSIFTIVTSLFDVYCLAMAAPGSTHYGYYVISFQFVYVGSKHGKFILVLHFINFLKLTDNLRIFRFSFNVFVSVRNVLIAFAFFSLIVGFAVLVTSCILISALRKVCRALLNFFKCFKTNFIINFYCIFISLGTWAQNGSMAICICNFCCIPSFGLPVFLNCEWPHIWIQHPHVSAVVLVFHHQCLWMGTQLFSLPGTTKPLKDWRLCSSKGRFLLRLQWVSNGPSIVTYDRFLLFSNACVQCASKMEVVM